MHQLTQPLHIAGAHIVQLSIRGDLAGYDLDIGELAHKRVCYGLEHQHSQRGLVGTGHIHQLAGFVFRHQTGALIGGRQVVHHGVQQHIDAVQGHSRAAEHRCNGTALYTLVDAVQDLVPGELLAREVLFKEGLVGFGNRLGHGRSQTFQTVAGIGHLCLGNDSALIAVGLVIDEVDVAVHLAVLHERNHQWADARAELGLELLQHLVEVGIFHIHLGDKEHLGTAQSIGQVIGLFGAHFHTVPGGNGNQHALSGDHAFVHTAFKVEQSGGVDQIDLGASPCKRCHGRRYRTLALDLLGVKVADGVAVRYLAEPV